MKTLTFKNNLKFCLALMLLLTFGCSNFLDKPLQGQLTQQSFPTTPNDALSATNAVYNTLRNSSFHFGLFPLMDIMSDDAYKGSNPTDQASTIGPYNTFTHLKTESTMADWWNTLYKGIRAANVVIEKVPAISMDASLNARYVGEASFLRALFYFDLARAWGGVPLVTATINPPTLTRSNIGDIYNLIISDLGVAIAGLPEKSGYANADQGRITKSAAIALLAKVYLFLPKPDQLTYTPQPDFVNAEKYALAIINSGIYSLEQDFSDANSVNGQYGVESIFEIGALPFEGIENGGDQYGNVQGVRGTPNRGWGFNRPSKELMASYEPGDPRQDKTIIFLGEVIDGITIIGDPSSSVPGELQCYNQKVWTPGSNVPTQFSYHRRMIRYADVLLMAAEATNENGKTSQALQYLNMVRARARDGNNSLLPDISVTDKEALRDIILNERRIELALEGHRFWDLIRTNKAAQVLGPLGFVTGKHELLAIPQTEVDLSHNALTQNPGW